MSGSTTGEVDGGAAVAEADIRSGTYSLLANLLGAPPERTVLQCLHRIEAAGVPVQDKMALAWARLKEAAEQTDRDAASDEYHQLFVGLGRGELVPYGSWYLTGFLLEKPLGDLRGDLALLGYERGADVRESEDHAAALCEIMALLITDDAVPIDVQRTFFETHLGSWMDKFFADLEAARNARFYKAVGGLGRTFIALEKQYLAMLV